MSHAYWHGGGAISANSGDIAANATSIGTLSSLTTTDKTSSVAAINEVDAQGKTNTSAILTNTGAISVNSGSITANTTSIGTLSSLTTTATTNTVAAINEVDAQGKTNAAGIGVNIAAIAVNTSAIGDLSTLGTADQTSAVAAINEIKTQLGDLSTLPTTNQTSIVAALTEMHGLIAASGGRVGNLSQLTTINKTDAVGAINEVHTIAQQNTRDIASNTNRIEILEDNVKDVEGGVAMAIAMANAIVLPGGKNGFSLSGSYGYFKGNSAFSVKAAYMPTDNVGVVASIATDLGNEVAVGASVGISF